MSSSGQTYPPEDGSNDRDQIIHDLAINEKRTSSIQYPASSIKHIMSITITKIERQKKNKQRYSLFSEDKFIVGISEESLLEFNIYSGRDLSEEVLTQIEKKENFIAIREQAWRFLARRMHSEKELRDKLINKGYDQENIDNIILELKNKNYLNDNSFARQLISDEIYLKKCGPVLIKNKLLKKGVEITLVSSLIDEFYDEELQYQNCRYFANKKFSSLKNISDSSKKTKLANFLIQKGFSWDICNRIISELDIT
ncbi:MAG: RecX family transcriptional regulator [Calditrichia bacterium]|nr:RecX family transcriptional regulator [Calditrichia bacterium]